MKYVDYNYYIRDFENDIIPPESFNRFAREASNKVRYYTSNRINSDNLNDDIRNATCLIAELLFNQEKLKLQVTNTTEKQIASETLGPRSISYTNNVQYQNTQIKTEQELNSAIYKICKEHINEELLFRGV